jgi:hypothetical protein
MDAIKESLRATTRDSFSPGFVLVAMKDDRIEPEDHRRLLEEACHALSRERQKLHQLETMIESAHRYVVLTAE